MTRQPVNADVSHSPSTHTLQSNQKAFRRNLADIHFLRVVNINTIAALYNDTRIMYLSAAMTCLKVSNMTTFPLILLATMSILMPEVRLSLA